MLSLPSLPPPAQNWPLAACKTLLEERIGWVQEDALMLDDGTGRWSRFCGSVSIRLRARASGTFSVSRQWDTTPQSGHGEKYHHSTITPHDSQPRIVLATFKCNTTSDFPRRLQCLVSPTALSTGRRWNTPLDAAANWCQRFELRVWPRHKDCLLMTCRRTITPSSSIAPRMLYSSRVRNRLQFRTLFHLFLDPYFMQH